ncbi:hypothetical protein CCYA_CCYA14G3838 [Cyanidiococcus yangmingshanensis]|nr:hypothetical protein CCYA_CCYA14G3838 [Cyanidiococcus yangmingshanensis]
MSSSHRQTMNGVARWSAAELNRFHQALEQQRHCERIDWPQVVAQVGTRTRRQVYRRWLRERRHQSLTAVADQGAVGASLSESSSSRKRRRGWSSTELARLSEACERFRSENGLVDLRQVTSFLGTRTMRQVRDRLRHRQCFGRTASAEPVDEAAGSIEHARRIHPSPSTILPVTLFTTHCDRTEWQALRAAHLWTTSARPYGTQPDADAAGPLHATLGPDGLSLAALLEAFYALGLGICPDKASDRVHMHKLLSSNAGQIETCVGKWRRLERLHWCLWQCGSVAAGTLVAFFMGPSLHIAESDENTWLQGILGEAGTVHRVTCERSSQGNGNGAGAYTSSWPSMHAFVAHGLVRWYAAARAHIEILPSDLLAWAVSRLRLDGLALSASMCSCLDDGPRRERRACQRLTTVPHKHTIHGARIPLLVKLGTLPTQGEKVLAYRGIYGSIHGSWIYGAPLEHDRSVRLGASLAAFMHRASQWSDTLGLETSSTLALHGCPLPNAALPPEQISEWNPIQTSAPTLPSGCMLQLAKTALENVEISNASPTATVCLAVLLEELIKVQRHV